MLNEQQRQVCDEKEIPLCKHQKFQYVLDPMPFTVTGNSYSTKMLSLVYGMASVRFTGLPPLRPTAVYGGSTLESNFVSLMLFSGSYRPRGKTRHP